MPLLGHEAGIKQQQLTSQVRAKPFTLGREDAATRGLPVPDASDKEFNSRLVAPSDSLKMPLSQQFQLRF